jgi:hypothetical protein
MNNMNPRQIPLIASVLPHENISRRQISRPTRREQTQRNQRQPQQRSHEQGLRAQQ